MSSGKSGRFPIEQESPSILEQQQELERIQNPQSNEEKKPLQNNECDSTSMHLDHSSPDNHLHSVPLSSASKSPEENSVYLYPPPSYYMASPTPSGTDSLNKNLNQSASLNQAGKQPNHVATFGSSVPESINQEYERLPLKHLGFETRRILGLHLDPERAAVRNWKTMADIMGFSHLEILNFAETRHKTMEVLGVYEVRQPHALVHHLIQFLTQMDRHDVLTELQQNFIRDLQRFKSPPLMPAAQVMSPSTSMRSTLSYAPAPPPTFYQDQLTSPIQEETISTSLPEKSDISTPEKCGSAFPDSPIITDSIPSKCDEIQSFDAFVLFDNADHKFILEELLPKIEGDTELRLCLPARDLDIGNQMYDEQLKYMIKSCPKLLVILSDEFLKGNSSKWALNIGISLDPAARERKIIPVIYKSISEPNILSGINACDRTRVLEDEWFWNNLKRSLHRGRN